MSQTNSQKKVTHNIKTEVDDFGRKKYRLEELQNNNQQDEEEKNDAHIDIGRHKSMLIARQEKLNIDKYMGKLQTNKKKKITEVFYCDICKEGFKCDMAFITHTNSPAHNRKLGMNMKVKGVSVDSVADKIKFLRQKKMQKSGVINEVDQLAQKYEEQNENQDQNSDYQQNAEIKQQDQDLKAKKKVQENVQEDDDNDNAQQQAEFQMMRALGLPTSFGSKRKKY